MPRSCVLCWLPLLPCAAPSYCAGSRLQDEIHMIKEKGQTDAMSYREQLAAKANKLKFTPEYLKVEAAQAISDRPKTYFSSKGSDFMQFWDSAFSTS